MDYILVRELGMNIFIVNVERHNQMSNLGSSGRQSGSIPSASVMLRDMEGHDSGYDDACRSQPGASNFRTYGAQQAESAFTHAAFISNRAEAAVSENRGGTLARRLGNSQGG